jgi:ribosomal protein L1
MEAAQDALFAEHDEGGTEAPKAAHDGKGNDRAEEKLDGQRNASGEDSSVKKEKSERHDHAEEEKHFIAQREANAHAGQSGEVCQSRNLLPVISMKTSSREGEAISKLINSLP